MTRREIFFVACLWSDTEINANARARLCPPQTPVPVDKRIASEMQKPEMGMTDLLMIYGRLIVAFSRVEREKGRGRGGGR